MNTNERLKAIRSLAETVEGRAEIEAKLSQFPIRERKTLELRLALAGNKKHTLKETGKELGGITGQRIRQIERRAIAMFYSPKGLATILASKKIKRVV